MTFNLRENILLVAGMLFVFTVLFFIFQRLTHRYYIGVADNISIVFAVLLVLYALTYIRPSSKIWLLFKDWLTLRNVAIFVTAVFLTWIIFFIVNNPFIGYLLYRKLVLAAVLFGIFFMLVECFASANDDYTDDKHSHHHR